MQPGGAWVLPAIAERIEIAARARGVSAATLASLGASFGGPGTRRASADRARALLGYVVRELGVDAFPWETARAAKPADYGAYGFAVQASADVDAALRRAAAYFPRVGSTARLRVLASPARYVVRLERHATADPDVAALGVEYMLGQIVTLLAAVSGGAARPREVRLAHLRTAGASSPSALGVEPRYGALADEIELDPGAATVALPRRDDDLAAFFDRTIEREEPPSGVIAEVRALVDDGDAVGARSEAKIARALAMSTRTMRRRLAAEGTSLRALVDQVRREVATSEIDDARLSLAALAMRLGFSDQTAFHRAFRRWTGVSPGEYRRGARDPIASDLASRGGVAAG
jgi:AraC-like DNA-binding protein